jgi:hypothetical protein
LRIYGRRRAPRIRADDCPTGSADTRRKILSPSTADLMTEYPADDASDYCSRYIDATRAGIDNLTFYPTTLLRWPDNRTYRNHWSLIESLALSAPVVIDGRWSGRSEALCFVGLARRFRGTHLGGVGLDARIDRVSLRRERCVLATNARRVLRGGSAFTGKQSERVHIGVSPALDREVIRLAECLGGLLKLGGCVRYNLRIASRGVYRQPRVVERGVAFRKRCTACGGDDRDKQSGLCRSFEHDGPPTGFDDTAREATRLDGVTGAEHWKG